MKRLIKQVFSFVYFFMALFFSENGLSFESVGSFEEHAGDFSIIARVRIESREPVSNGGVESGSNLSGVPICGYYYTATVVESLKGDVRRFSFFNSVDSDFSGMDKDYLVFLYKRDPEEARADARLIENRMLSDKEIFDIKLSCKSFGEYYTGTRIQTMLPFNTDASRTGDGEWVSEAKRNPFEICTPDITIKGGKILQKVHGNYVFKEVEPGKGEVVLEWQGLKRLIDTALKAGAKPELGPC